MSLVFSFSYFFRLSVWETIFPETVAIVLVWKFATNLHSIMSCRGHTRESIKPIWRPLLMRKMNGFCSNQSGQWIWMGKAWKKLVKRLLVILSTSHFLFFLFYFQFKSKTAENISQFNKITGLKSFMSDQMREHVDQTICG